MSDLVYAPILPIGDLEEDSPRLFDIGGWAILICRDAENVYAVENRCSHLDEPLACGKMKWGWIACPAHGARFDLSTGEPMNRPATSPIRTFPVRIVAGMIEVAI